MDTQLNLLKGKARPTEKARFNGPTYEAEHDKARLTGQILRVFNFMCDGTWRTLEDIAQATGDPHASISAQLRHLRKERFGGHTIDKRPRSERSLGLWEYRLIVKVPSPVREANPLTPPSPPPPSRGN